jgi:hypothetical protein
VIDHGELLEVRLSVRLSVEPDEGHGEAVERAAMENQNLLARIHRAANEQISPILC